MSFWATTWAFEQEPRTSGAKFTLVCLASYADENGHCYPSQQTLATMMGLQERSVRGHLANLEEDGLIRREERRADSGQRTSDGIWLLAPEGRLKPPAKIAGSEKPTGRKLQNQPAKNCNTNRQKLPGNLLVEQSVEQVVVVEDNVTPLDSDTRDAIATLKGIKNWKKSDRDTLSLLAELKRDIPGVDALQQCKDLAFNARYGERPIKNLALTLRNYFRQAAKSPTTSGNSWAQPEPFRRKKKRVSV